MNIIYGNNNVNTSIYILVKSTPMLSGCAGRNIVPKGGSLQCPITADLDSVRLDIFINGVFAKTATTNMVDLPLSTSGSMDVR